MSGFVFYDENGNGALDPGEGVRLPGVTIEVGGRTAQSAAGGRFMASDVPAGVQSVSPRPSTLPVHFRASAPLSLVVPASGDLAVPASLPLGAGMHANAYMAFGDSITEGEGTAGYRDLLQADLRAHWGKGDVLNEGIGATRSDDGRWRIAASLATRKPAYALILYGTNDWNIPNCRDNPPCDTVDNLLWMIQVTRDDWGAHPVLGTIPPVNPLYVDKQAEERNDWVLRMNGFVRTMARREQVAIAEVHGAFLSRQNSPSLFSDEKHPSEAGYGLISQAFFNAITQPYSASTSMRGRALFLRP